MSAHTIKPGHAAIKTYHAALQTFAVYGADHEGATETAFSRLLADTSRGIGWTLIPKQSMKAGGKAVIPVGTLRDLFLVRGYWEAKDTGPDRFRTSQRYTNGPILVILSRSRRHAASPTTLQPGNSVP